MPAVTPPPAQQPRPAPATPEARAARPAKPRKKRRFLRLLSVFVVLAVSLVALAMVVTDARLNRVPTPSIAGSGPGTYLIVGSDSRENLPDDLEGRFGSFAGQRADVIILAHVSGGTVQMLSLPRDLKVSIDGHGTDKINAAYAYGGADLLASTIQNDLGVGISHYMEVEFGGFAEIVDAVGGVELTFEYPTRDAKSGLDVPAGTQVVDGATALAFVRSRATEELRDGSYQSAQGGDIARTSRQRQVLEAVIRKALTPGGVVRAPSLANSVTASIRVGEQTHTWNLGLFGFRFVTAPASESMALPVTGSSEGGVSYVVRTEAATQAIAAFVSGNPLPIED